MTQIPTGDADGASADTSGDSADTSGDSADTSGDSADTSGDSADTSGDSADTSGDSADTSGDSADTSGDSADTVGYEGYPYASVEAERRIKLIATLMSLVTVGMLLAGLYLALGTERFGVGGLLTLVGFIALMMVPFVAKRMRRAALAREAGQA